MKRKGTKKLLAAALSVVMAFTSLPVQTVGAKERAAGDAQPVIWFDMENLTGDKLINKSTGKEVTVAGNAALASGKEGEHSLKLDGTTYIDLDTSFQPQSDYTMMGWIRQDAGATDGQAIFARGYSGNVDDQLAMLVKGGSIYHSVAFSSGSENKNYQEFNTSAAVTTEKWTAIAITRSGSTATVYVNGEKIYEQKNLPTDGFAAASKKMYVGMDCNKQGELYSQHAFRGLMDDLRLYDQALDAEAVREIYQQSSSGFTINEVQNGQLTVRFEKAPSLPPEASDITLKLKDGEKQLDSSISGFSYNEADKTITITFTPVENYTQGEKTIDIIVEYGEEFAAAKLILPAGDNQAPKADAATVANLSPKLGNDPHVKGMLKVNYTYSDPDNDAEGESKFQWYISDSRDGGYTPIQGIRTRTVILLDKYAGKYLRCQVTPSDCHGNRGEAVMSEPAAAPVQATVGNPLTDWLHESGYGVSHHFLSNYFNLSHVYASPEEMWDRSKMTWNEFVGQFDAEAYAKQIHDIGAKYVILTLGQNSGSYCAPNAVYDKYMREAGLLGEGEANPKTTSMENDLPMRIAEELAQYDIKLMLYLPSNPPHSACWDESGTPNGYGYFSDYLVTKKVFDYTPGSDGIPSQKARKVLSEMVEWWSQHYGDKISGWWFDGCYPGGVLESQTDMSLEYNLSTLANAAKAGNPYNIVTFNQGLDVNWAFKKSNDYQDYTAGESQGLNTFPVNGRWAANSTDCQNFMFGPIGNRGNWSGGWGCSGISRTEEFLIQSTQTAIEKDYAIGFDAKVNIFGSLDPDQYRQMLALKTAIRDNGQAPAATDIKLDKTKLTLNTTGDREIISVNLQPTGAKLSDLEIKTQPEGIAQVSLSGNTLNVVAKAPGTTTLVLQSKENSAVKAECTVEVAGRTPKAIYDDTSDQFTYSADKWIVSADRPADSDGFSEYNKTVHATNVQGANVSFAFEGTGFDFMSTANTDQGLVKISIDGGEPVTIDLSVPGGWVKKAYGLTAYGKYDLPYGKHTVTISNASSGKYMIIDAVRIYEESAEQADKAALTGLVNQCNKLKEEDFTAQSWAGFAEELSRAQEVLAKESASQSEIDKAFNSLLAARLGLQEVQHADKKELNALIKQAKEYDLSNCRPGKVQAFEIALAKAEEVAADPKAIQADVDKASDALLEAIVNLKEIVDRSDLTNLMEILSGLNGEDYTAASFAVLTQALENAAKINDDSSVKEVNDAYRALQQAYLQLERVEPAPDKSALANAIKNAELILSNIDSFKPATVAGLDKILEQAKVVYDNPDAALAEVEQAVNDLTAANAKAQVKEDKEILITAVEKAEALNASDYTAESFAALTQVLAGARLVMEDGDATREQVEQAAAAIDDAIANLVKAGGSTEDPSEPSSSEEENPGSSSGTGSENAGGTPTQTGDSAAWPLIAAGVAAMAAAAFLLFGRRVKE